MIVGGFGSGHPQKGIPTPLPYHPGVRGTFAQAVGYESRTILMTGGVEASEHP